MRTVMRCDRTVAKAGVLGNTLTDAVGVPMIDNGNPQTHHLPPGLMLEGLLLYPQDSAEETTTSKKGPAPVSWRGENVGSGYLIIDQLNIGDFQRWKDHDAYQLAFNRVLRD